MTISSPITKQTLDHVQEETDYELPLSQEVKSPAYPQGPICIYDPNVYLYLEPTYIEAAEFDVVLNVAREVKNPFTTVGDQGFRDMASDAPDATPKKTQTAHLAGRDIISEPHTAISERSITSGFEAPAEDTARTAPGTPKASRPQPEYIHVPWDHNTNVVDDLLKLCELIDDRVRQEKRVLVHCQCGVSRSASLVVAYGLYKNPQHTVQEAYDAVKNRSRWIGPNMNLIYQLSEFKTKLSKLATTGSHGWPSWRNMGPPRPTTSSSALIPEAPSTSLRAAPQKSLSAPSQLERANSFNLAGSSELLADPKAGDITPGPSSAPPGMAWSPEAEPADSISTYEESSRSQFFPSLMDVDADLSLSPLAVEGDAIRQRQDAPAGAVASDLQEIAKVFRGNPVRASTVIRRGTVDKGIQAPAVIPTTPGYDYINNVESATLNASASKALTLQPNLGIHSLRSQPSLPAGFSSLLTRRQNTHRLPIRQETPLFTAPQLAQSFNPASNYDVPPTPSLLSPRAAEFTASPFHRTSAGDLAGSSLFEQGLMSPGAVDKDPRSPHQIGEASITRNIFDMLDFNKTPR